MKRATKQHQLRDAIATAEVLFSLGESEARALAAGLRAEERTDFAQALCTAVFTLVWESRAKAVGCDWELRKPVAKPTRRFPGLVRRLAGALGTLPAPRVGFLSGQLYTALLPDSLRKSLGAYYTPPPLVDRLLELVTAVGFDWKTGRVIDPACGGAAFLASVAPKLVRASRGKSPVAALEDIESRLLGVEVDPFAAWMSMVLLDMALLELTMAAKRPLKPLVICADTLGLDLNEIGQFDLVIGNPPYGRVTLTPAQRKRFTESLFGHANLYGVFTEAAVRLAKPAGIIAYVTPTSFLGGEYFKNLRRFLCKHAPLRRLEFVSDRDGVFEGVLQETMLAVFERQPSPNSSGVAVNMLYSEEATKPVVVESVGRIAINESNGNAWLLPRTAGQLRLVRSLNAMPHRLADYGFGVSTGQLVWNRHKDQLRAGFGEDCFPIIWAEAVGSDGTFQFQAARRTHLPYLKLRRGQEFLLNQEPCILVQRTTAKEQKRRLIAAVIPNSFVMEYPGFVVENHLNMVYSLSAKPRIALRTLAALLNSNALDQAFRCINGSVAVSAYELNSLPLPAPEQMTQLQELVFAKASLSEIENQIAAYYSLHESIGIAPATYPRSHHRKVAA